MVLRDSDAMIDVATRCGAAQGVQAWSAREEWRPAEFDAGRRAKVTPKIALCIRKLWLSAKHDTLLISSIQETSHLEGPC